MTDAQCLAIMQTIVRTGHAIQQTIADATDGPMEITLPTTEETYAAMKVVLSSVKKELGVSDA